MTDEQTPEPARPLLRVVSGDPSPEELAALIAVVASRGAGGSAPPPKPRSEWNHPARAVRGDHRVGSGVWRTSAFGQR